MGGGLVCASDWVFWFVFITLVSVFPQNVNFSLFFLLVSLLYKKKKPRSRSDGPVGGDLSPNSCSVTAVALRQIGRFEGLQIIII